jgi:nucleoside-diphosphate-sugar epimerase
MSNSRKIWLIGADSFTGNHLLPRLEKGDYHVDTEEVDITDVNQVEDRILQIKPDYIINLAAISFVPDGEDESIYAVNTFGPQNILSACLKLSKPPKNIILASSANIYGLQDKEQVNEDCKPNPLNHYGCSKWSMEQIAQTYSSDLNITITRPFNYTGAGQQSKFIVPKIVEHFKQKSPTLKLGNIDIWRDFSDVRWIAEVYTCLLATPANGIRSVNLCSGRLIAIKEIITILQDVTGHEINIETDQGLMRQADIKRQCGDNKKLFELLPALSPPIAFEKTIQWMVDSQ